MEPTDEQFASTSDREIEMKTPMTLQNFVAWQGMVSQGMPWDCAYQRMADWAGMLEVALAELDPNYQSRPWGLNFDSPIAAVEKPK